MSVVRSYLHLLFPCPPPGTVIYARDPVTLVWSRYHVRLCRESSGAGWIWKFRAGRPCLCRGSYPCLLAIWEADQKPGISPLLL